MASRLALARAKERQQQPEAPDRVPQRIKRQRKAREARFAKEARKARPANGGSGYLLNDPDYHMGRCAGFDVMRRDLRKPEPPLRPHRKPNPYYDPAAVEPVPSAECATWRWWKGLTPGERHAMYELAHEGEPPTGVTVLNMGLEISNPQFVVEVW